MDLTLDSKYSLPDCLLVKANSLFTGSQLDPGGTEMMAGRIFEALQLLMVDLKLEALAVEERLADFLKK